MLVYEKTVSGVRHLYGTTANVPSDNDAQLKYKDIDGDELTIVTGDSYVDNGSGGIIRKSDDKFMGVFIGDATSAIIPKDWQPETKVLTSIAVTKKPTKISYTVGENLAVAGMVVTATYQSGDKEKVTTYTTSPADGASVGTTAGDVTVTVSYTEGSVTKTTTFKITVTAAEE